MTFNANATSGGERKAAWANFSKNGSLMKKSLNQSELVLWSNWCNIEKVWKSNNSTIFNFYRTLFLHLLPHIFTNNLDKDDN